MNRPSLAIGVDIGGTTTKCGIVNHSGTIVGTGSVLTTSMYNSPEAFVEALYKALLIAIEKVGFGNIKGIGVGVPNGNAHTGTIEYAPNLPWKGVVHLAKMISEGFGCSLCANQRCQCGYNRRERINYRRQRGGFHSAAFVPWHDTPGLISLHKPQGIISHISTQGTKKLCCSYMSLHSPNTPYLLQLLFYI